MSWEFHFDKKIKTMFWRVFGAFGDEDLARCQFDCHNHPQYDCMWNQVYDFTEVEQVSITPAGMWGVIRGRQSSAGGKVALVASTNLGFGLGRMFENMQGGAPLEVHVFRERSEAMRWLKLGEENWPWKEQSEASE